jgi:hypothetical protein
MVIVSIFKSVGLRCRERSSLVVRYGWMDGGARKRRRLRELDKVCMIHAAADWREEELVAWRFTVLVNA